MGWLRRRRERRLRLGGSMPSRYQDLGPGSDPHLGLGADPASSHDLGPSGSPGGDLPPSPGPSPSLRPSQSPSPRPGPARPGEVAGAFAGAPVGPEVAPRVPAGESEALPMPSESQGTDLPDLWPQVPRVFTPIRGVRVFVGIVAAMVLFGAWSTAPVGWVTLAPVYLLLAGAWLESVYARIEVQPTSIRLRSLRGDRTFGRAELGEAVAHQLPRRQHNRTDPGVNLSVRLRGERFGMRLTGVLWPRETLHELSRIVRATPFTARSFRELEANYPGSTRFWNRQMWVPALAILGYIWVSTQYAPLLVG